MNEGPFGNCKQAQLHQIPQIQSYGGLIIIDKQSHLIVGASANIEKFIGQPKAELQGQPWSKFLTPNMVDTMLMSSERDTSIARLLNTEINQQVVEISNHCAGGCCLVEFQFGTETTLTNMFSEKADFLMRLHKAKNAFESAELLMNEIARYIEYDRVMLYKFLPDWHGEVIAENNKPRVEGFMGLRFPEGDIPANARRIFTLNLQRLIADVNEPQIAIELVNTENKIDLTWSQLRAVHPVHLRYLNNMGVQASFTLSIVCEGKLWGMIACHHLSPKLLSIHQRQHCEELVRICALHMNSVIASNIEQQRYGYRVTLSQIRGAINSQKKGFNAINICIAELKKLFNADGIWHHFEGKDLFSGNVPDKPSLSLLKNWVDGLDHNKVSTTDNIPSDLSVHPSLVRFCSGLLHIPLNNNDFILLMRQEQVETVNWAGKPHSLKTEDESVLALTPRASFQQWTEHLKGKSLPWNVLEIESADLLRSELIDYIEQSEIEAMALKDPLTGLANRMLFERELERSLQKSIEADHMFAVYMIDLDNFKPVNDTFGHAAGDEVLIQVSQRMSSLLREEDTVARLGGDEFAVLLSNVQDQITINEIAERLLDEIKRPIDFATHKISIGASIGVSICPLDAATQAELMEDADVALYEVKKAGRDGFKRFDRNMLNNQQLSENNRVFIETAFSENQFEFLYQPLLDIRGKTLLGFETFCVWNHPSLGRLNASDFIDLIEHNKLSTEWAMWGFRSLFSQYQQWYRAGLRVLPLCMNITAKQFLNMDISGICSDLASEYQVGTSWLRLDLDEQTLLMSSRRAEEKINKLNDKGILVNIDHFGQGLVSLRQLAELKINSLKITGRFLNKNDSKTDMVAQVAIFKSISNVIKVPMTATQVEDAPTLQKVKQHGIHHIQGYIISVPMAADLTTKWLTEPGTYLDKLSL